MSREWTDEQRELFERDTGGKLLLPRVAVAADAGAGKTSVLVQRVRNLPTDKRILCVSFTEKSKADLEQKLADHITAEVYTIHGFCGRIVSEFGALAGLPPFFRIMDADERDEVFYRSFEKVYRRSPPANLDHGVDRFWGLCRMAQDAGDGALVHDGAAD
ncbi:MAG: UvrD-helicase domain-containing protein, partial [Deltaproteobacteria bacterium]|nr:UvrD-helicase domain-containing protein [Deltaproteobacteria bacterium]